MDATPGPAEELPGEELPVIAPMLATPGTVADLSAPEQWAYEVKWDGYRAVAAVRGDRGCGGDGGGDGVGGEGGAGGVRRRGALRLRSRSGQDLTAAYPELGELTTLLAGHDAVLDGEIVAFDAAGRTDFGRLQHRGDPGLGVRVHFLVFDVLHLDGVSLLAQPYPARREILDALLHALPDAPAAGDGHVHVPPTFGSDLDVALEVSRSMRLEGIMAKRLDSTYLPGRRSRAWIKIKHVRAQEVVVVGWTPGTGRRAGTLGALLLAVPVDGSETGSATGSATGSESEWAYVGKVGTGFTDRALGEIRELLAPLERATPAVADVPRPDARDAHWVEPSLVGEVSYAEWTATGRLRHPAWRGWRPDKSAAQVRREP